MRAPTPSRWCRRTLTFVWEFSSAYLASPLDVLHIRDGGWSPTAGFVGAWLFALTRQGQLPAAKKALRAALLAGTVLWAAGAAVLTVRPATGQELPALSFASLEGQTVTLAQFKGKPIMVNLWATWCPPFVREVPMLHQAQIDRPGLNFVFLNQGEPADTVGAWLQARKLPMRNVLMDGNRQAGAALKQRALRTTLFFDAKGRLVNTRIGELSAATLRAMPNKSSRAWAPWFGMGCKAQTTAIAPAMARICNAADCPKQG